LLYEVSGDLSWVAHGAVFPKVVGCLLQRLILRLLTNIINGPAVWRPARTPKSRRCRGLDEGENPGDAVVVVSYDGAYGASRRIREHSYSA
jgi:hypothetical protein